MFLKSRRLQLQREEILIHQKLRLPDLLMYLKNKTGVEAKLNRSAEILTLISLSIELCLNALLCKRQTKKKKPVV